MAKMIAFDEKARHGLETSLNALIDAVKVTLGPKGYNAALERKQGIPLITGDGVSIAHETELENPYEKIGAELVRGVAKKAGDVAGGGTTTITVLAQALVSEGLRDAAAGSNPIGIRHGIEKAVTAVIEKLLEFAKDIETKEQIVTTAGISAADPTIGELIATVTDKVGEEGIITVEEANAFGFDLEPAEGMHFDKGYISGYFATDMGHQETALEGPYILLVSDKISSIKDLLPLLEKAIQSGKPLLIIAEDVEDETLPILVVNKIRGTFESVAMETPGFGDHRKAVLQDMAILTDGQIISEGVGPSLETADLPLLGCAHKVVITKDETIIVEGAGDQSTIEGHVSQIYAEIKDSDSDYDKGKLQERLAKFAGGVAVIKAGTTTKIELKERKCYTKDAARNAKATAEEGTTAGGGSALLQVSHVSDGELGLTGDETTGVRIVYTALIAPLRQITLSAGLEAGAVTEKVASLPQGEGLNTATGEYIGLMEAGTNGPVEITRFALQNAASIAALFLTTRTAVVDKPESTMPTISGGDEMSGVSS